MFASVAAARCKTKVRYLKIGESRMDHVQSLFEVMYSRRSIRCYQEDKMVEPDKVIMLLKAAMAAPSACNLQPWKLLLLTRRTE